jgi:hypothetical protein
MEKYKYKGITVYHNKEGSRFGTEYWSAANEHVCKNGNNPHTYGVTKEIIHQIIDCYSLYRKTGHCGKYRRDIKNRALRLAGICIIF